MSEKSWIFFDPHPPSAESVTYLPTDPLTGVGARDAHASKNYLTFFCLAYNMVDIGSKVDP